MILYVAKRGPLFAGWWDTEPPRLKDGKCPKFRAPDVWHDRAHEADVADTVKHLVDSKIIKQPSALGHIPLEWASVALSQRKPAAPKPPPSGVLFDSSFMQPTAWSPETEAARERLKVG